MAPLVFVVPDTFGTHLRDADGRIWLDEDALKAGGLTRLSAGRDITTDGVIAAMYGPLVEALEKAGFEVDAFDYDWRLPIGDAATRLRAAVQDATVDPDRVVHVVGHGAGGLIAAAALDDAALLETLRGRKAKLVALGVPFGGSPDILRMLSGAHPLSKMLARIAGVEVSAVVPVFAGWPGLAECGPGRQPRLNSTLVQQMLTTVAGSGVPTPAAEDANDGQQRLRCRLTGDGRVLLEDARVEGATNVVLPDTGHADLVVRDAALTTCTGILTGASTDLTVRVPALDRPVEAREETVPETVSSVDLIEAAWAALARRITPVFRLTVSVSHGHLRQARFPLAVGHYSGDTIVSAEASLDAALDGRLRRRLDLDTYPGPMGTVEVVRVPGAHPPGAIVIGLGNVGQLTPQILTSLVAQAAVRHALQVAEAPSGSTWQSAAISSLFIGTDGGGAVGLSDSIRSIVLGVVEANRKLRATDMWNRVRIDRLEFVELFEETAVKAAHVVDSLPRLLERDLTRAEEVFGKPRLEVQQGGEFLRPTEHAYGGGWWRRIQVKANEPATDSPPAGRRALELVYKPLSDQARLQQSTSVQSVDQVARLVGAAMLQPATDLRLSNALFELLVPPALKESFRQQGDLILVLDRHAARYPFELMAYRTNETRPLVTTCGLLRQLEGPDDASGVESNMGRDVLVIGPPVAKGWRALPGASEEAHLVVRLSERYGYRPTALVDANSQDVQKALFASDPRILHIAAHGQYDDDPLQSGVVIGDGEFLTTAHVRAMRTVPELVFLNCCHLGKLGIASRSGTANLPAEGYPALAASLAEGFMTAGARAVVAAGWAIDDTAGQTFARSFYERFLDGEPFGRAVHDARKDTYTNHGGSNTWGAYQCYGSPDFRMRTPAKSVVKRPTRRPVSRSELVAALRSLAGRAGGAQGADLLDIVDEFKERSVQAKEGGWQDGQVLAELAAVAAELGDFHHAIELYRQALNVAKGLAPLSAVEQLANMLGRHAPSLRVAKQSGAAAPALGLFNEALAWLKWLDARLERSPERLALRGSLHKRWALLTSGRQRRQHLRAAADSYEAASKKSTREAYQLLNGLALRYLLDRRRQYAELARLAHAERARCEQALADGAEPTFWDRVAIPDALLHATLFDGQITAPPQVAAITAAYRGIRTTGPSARELASVRDQLEFLAEILSDPDYAKPSAPADCLKPFLDTLR